VVSYSHVAVVEVLTFVTLSVVWSVAVYEWFVVRFDAASVYDHAVAVPLVAR
jgi:hypothetical protein